MSVLVVAALLAARGLSLDLGVVAVEEQERTWLGWSVGFVPALIVIGTAYVVVRRLRSKR